VAGGWLADPAGPDRFTAANHVPAKGILEWCYATVPTGFGKDTWVTSIEVQPGDPSVLHHAGVFVKPHTSGEPAAEDPPASLGALAAVYVPGFPSDGLSRSQCGTAFFQRTRT